jgi:2-polyprenyl-3-methyl-5-hydroxy-6-metoxy-1,4-benzoquinol methylase
VPFDHNDHYHRLLLRQAPRNCKAALDVGCGTGRFARRLAGLGAEVDAIDPSARVIAQARDLAGDAPGPRFRQADLSTVQLPQGHYDFISCLASIHHTPFDTVTALRAALAPGGVLVILGCHREHGPVDLAWSLAAVPVNMAARLSVAAAERLRPAGPGTRSGTKPPVKAPAMRLPEIRAEAANLLPGCRIRRLLFWRYLLVFRNNSVA